MIYAWACASGAGDRDETTLHAHARTATIRWWHRPISYTNVNVRLTILHSVSRPNYYAVLYSPSRLNLWLGLSWALARSSTALCIHRAHLRHIRVSNPSAMLTTAMPRSVITFLSRTGRIFFFLNLAPFTLVGWFIPRTRVPGSSVATAP